MTKDKLLVVMATNAFVCHKFQIWVTLRQSHISCLKTGEVMFFYFKHNLSKNIKISNNLFFLSLWKRRITEKVDINGKY